jgi:hypothetical protein
MSDMVYERKAGTYRDQPEVVLKAQVTRKPYRRGLRYGLLLVLCGIGVWYLLMLPNISGGDTPWVPETVETVSLGVGRIVAGLLVLIGAARLVVNIALVILRKPQQIIFYDQGFTWKRRKDTHKYRWEAVKSVREDPNAWFIGNRRLLQWGRVTLKMRDGEVFHFTGAHGDLLAFLQNVRPFYADAVGARMAQILRQNKPFAIHKSVQVQPGGLVIDGNTKVGWQHLQLDMTGKHLLFRQVQNDGNLKTVKRLPLKQVNNLAGFLELAESTMANFQRPTRVSRYEE